MDELNNVKISNVSAEDVKKAIDEKVDCILLDVRTQEEYSRGKIAGSINIPVDKIESDILSRIPDTSAKIYVYCLSGSRSIHAVQILTNLGYSNVCNVISGLLAWRVKGYPVTN
jgi:phage shock protein E